MSKKLLEGFCFCLLFSIAGRPAFGQSRAHALSSFAIIDPSYNARVNTPVEPVNRRYTWLYGPGELECFRLELLRRRTDSARLNVGYTGDFHKPYATATFVWKREGVQQIRFIRFKAVGKGKVLVNGRLVDTFGNSNAIHSFSLAGFAPVRTVSIYLNAADAAGPEIEVPALLPLSPDRFAEAGQWNWQSPEGSGGQQPAYGYLSDSLRPPHQLEDPAVRVDPVALNNRVSDFKRELIGHIFIRSSTRPVIRAGESVQEAIATGHEEQSSEMISIGPGLWRTKTPVAFRYVQVKNGAVGDLWSEAIFHPERYKGAFACSDSVLTRIWMTSAYTLRLCMHDFLLDGVKRDRLPWAGDLAMSALVDAYTFGDQELVRRSLVALGRAGIQDKDINGIVDFSLWWIIAQDQYQLYFGDTAHLKRAWPVIQAALKVLAAERDSHGFLVPRKNTRLFIDWVKQEKWTTLQILWWWAQKSAVRLAGRMHDTVTMHIWENRAQDLKKQLYAAAWNPNGKYWYAKDSLSMKIRHPNFFAVVSGLSGEKDRAGIRAFLLDSTAQPVGTPYMYGFEMMGLANVHAIDAMFKKVKQYWGGMLANGATTFWEAYNIHEKGEGLYAFYNRPYGKSLCHAWSSGPAAFLISEIFGLKPVEDGWKRFLVKPDLGTLTWASTTVPTPYGPVKVDVQGNQLQVQVPKGTALQWDGQLINGPADFHATLKQQ